MSMTSRIAHSGTRSCCGTSTSRNVPIAGKAMPATSTIQMTEPNVMPSSRIWRDAGTRPKSRVLAQPRAVVRTLLANRDPNATRAARMATATV